MKEVKIREVSNGYVVEYWSVPTKFGDRESMLELNCTEVHRSPLRLLAEVGKYFDFFRDDEGHLEVSFIPVKKN